MVGGKRAKILNADGKTYPEKYPFSTNISFEIDTILDDGTDKKLVELYKPFTSTIEKWTSDINLSLTKDNYDDGITTVEYGRTAETYRLKIDLGLQTYVPPDCKLYIKFPKRNAELCRLGYDVKPEDNAMKTAIGVTWPKLPILENKSFTATFSISPSKAGVTYCTDDGNSPPTLWDSDELVIDFGSE